MTLHWLIHRSTQHDPQGSLLQDHLEGICSVHQLLVRNRLRSVGLSRGGRLRAVARTSPQTTQTPDQNSLAASHGRWPGRPDRRTAATPASCGTWQARSCWIGRQTLLHKRAQQMPEGDPLHGDPSFGTGEEGDLATSAWRIVVSTCSRYRQPAGDITNLSPHPPKPPPPPPAQRCDRFRECVSRPNHKRASHGKR
jgi:hypothetical protein